jgi:hypothetical protein
MLGSTERQHIPTTGGGQATSGRIPEPAVRFKKDKYIFVETDIFARAVMTLEDL